MKADLLTPTQKAFVAALQAAVDPSVGDIRHTMKQDAQPPFFLIGNIDSEPVEARGAQLELLTVEIQCVYRGSDREVLLGMMHQARAACDEVPLPEQPGVEFGLPRFAGSAVSSTPADGVTFAGLINFEVHVQPA